jgi:hypothetical protein
MVWGGIFLGGRTEFVEFILLRKILPVTED